MRRRGTLLKWRRMYSPDSVPAALKPGKRGVVKRTPKHARYEGVCESCGKKIGMDIEVASIETQGTPVTMECWGCGRAVQLTRKPDAV